MKSSKLKHSQRDIGDSKVVPVSLSVLDGERFGVRTARAMNITGESLPAVLEFSYQQGVQFLISRCSTQDLSVAQAMERVGFELMDTLVYYRFSFQNKGLPELRSVPIRFIGPGDAESIRQIAREAFHGYRGHYHADPRLDRFDCDDVYVDWAGRSCLQKDMADEVLIAEPGGELLGFLTLKMLNTKEVDGRLFAVSPVAQSKGLGQALLIEGLHWCKSRGMRAMIISTQITNLASQISWVRVGFDPYESFYIFHKWFDEEQKNA